MEMNDVVNRWRAGEAASRAEVMAVGLVVGIVRKEPGCGWWLEKGSVEGTRPQP